MSVFVESGVKRFLRISVYSIKKVVLGELLGCFNWVCAKGFLSIKKRALFTQRVSSQISFSKNVRVGLKKMESCDDCSGNDKLIDRKSWAVEFVEDEMEGYRRLLVGSQLRRLGDRGAAVSLQRPALLALSSSACPGHLFKRQMGP